MKYFVRVGDEELEVTVDGETVTVEGESPVTARLEDLALTPFQLLTLGDEVHRILGQRGDHRGQYNLSVEGFLLSVEALDERGRAIRDLSGESRKVSGASQLFAPMPGLVVRVNVAEGDTVRAGQGLVVMEAMKMENELRATAAGVVRKVHVTPGNAVEKGALLLETDSNHDHQ
jgi:biotin carboxyl carrier protein